MGGSATASVPASRASTTKSSGLYKWAGAQWEGHDTWEPLENLQAPRVRAMVSEYNKNKRVARA